MLFVRPLWAAELPWPNRNGPFQNGCAAAGDHLYACDEDGVTTVVHASLPPKVVSKNQLHEGMRASPAVADGAIYLRTFHSLYKIAAARAK